MVERTALGSAEPQGQPSFLWNGNITATLAFRPFLQRPFCVS